jgi:hypothetical protein
VNPDRKPAEAGGFWSAVVAAAVVATASDWMAGVRARKSGRDPAALEASEDALSGLQSDQSNARTLAHRIRLLEGEDGVAEAGVAVRKVGALIHVSRLGPVMHRIHQRLLSLYPLVDEMLVEQARQAEAWVDACAGGELPAAEMARRIDDLLDQLPTVPGGS